MNIQSNFNRILSIAGVLSTLRKRTEESKPQTSKVETKPESIAPQPSDKPPSVPKESSIATAEKTEEPKKSRKPRAKGPKKSSISQVIEESNKAYAAAEDFLKLKQDERRRSRKPFIEHIKNTPTNLGVPVGKLPKNIQDAIELSLSESEKETIMKERKNGKK
jgi:hypothetical protein